jgi:hypothetical protein
MAWISVHDHVDGKKLRRMSKMLNCSKAEALGILNFLWFWGLNNADENGRIEDADRDDIAEVLSGKTQLPLDEVVTALFNSGWLDDVEGCIYLHDWSDWQEQWYKFRKKKDYDAKRKRLERSRSKGDHEPDPPPQEEPQEAPSAPKPDEPPQDTGDQEEKATSGRKKPKRETVRMTEFVHLTEREYQKLCAEYGEKAAKLMIQELDLYKGAKGKSYKDDYRAILSWVVDRVKERYPGAIEKQSTIEGNPFKEFEGSDG